MPNPCKSGKRWLLVIYWDCLEAIIFIKEIFCSFFNPSWWYYYFFLENYNILTAFCLNLKGALQPASILIFLGLEDSVMKTVVTTVIRVMEAAQYSWITQYARNRITTYQMRYGNFLKSTICKHSIQNLIYIAKTPSSHDSTVNSIPVTYAKTNK